MASKMFRINNVLCVVGSAALALLSGCTSGGNEGKTQPVNLEQFTAGADRFAVMSTVGQSEGQVQHEGRQCDIYKLYTSGLGVGGKAAMAAAEMLTGVSTFGLSEAVWAPVKAGINPNVHTVLFCYAQNEQLVDIYDKNPTSLLQAEHRIVNAQLYTPPAATPAGGAASQNSILPLIPGQVSATVTQPAGLSAPVPATGAGGSAPAAIPVSPNAHSATEELNSLSVQKVQAPDAGVPTKGAGVVPVPAAQPDVLDPVHPVAQ